MTKFKNLLLLIFISVIYGCSNQTEVSEILIPKNVNEFAKAYINNIHEGNIDTCLLVSGTEINNEKGREFLTNTYNNIKYFDSKSIKVVGYKAITIYGSKGFTNYFVDYEYNYGKFVYYSLFVHEKDNKLTVVGFNGQMFEKSLAEINKFTFSGKGFLHYIFLIIMLYLQIFTVFTIFSMVKTPMKRKWLWIIGALVGIMSLNLNWTTGEFGFEILRITLLGIGFAKSGPVAPWIASFSIPLISIIFWIRRESFFVNAEFEKKYEAEIKEREELLKYQESINS